ERYTPTWNDSTPPVATYRNPTTVGESSRAPRTPTSAGTARSSRYSTPSRASRDRRVPRRNVPLSGPRVVPTAVSPLPVLEERAEWRAEESFPDRGELAAGAAAACAALAADLREAAGDRWPPAPRARR
ncbi:MAG TPA: hypothetical protein VM529_20915, partial [Gemmata sp.]|nr:hypothetical protein [Gemmata sp.]